LPNNTGVEIDAGAASNLVGTNGDGVNDVSERNLLSGNLFAGVWITGQGTMGNAVAGN
jgi:titin